MCSTVVIRTLFAITAAVVPVAQAGGQGLRDYQRRADSLTGVWHRATAARVAYEESLARDYSSYDTVVAGPIRVLAEPRTAMFARHAATFADSALSPVYGR